MTACTCSARAATPCGTTGALARLHSLEDLLAVLNIHLSKQRLQVVAK